MRMRVPLYDPRSDYYALKEKIDSAINEVLDSGLYVLGPQVEAFEREFATYCGARYAVGVGSGTAALALALRACGIEADDEVITVPNTDIATAAAITHCGAKVVFVDVEPHSLVMDPREIEPQITSRTKAILPVHLFGQPVDMAVVQEIAATRNLSVIEDAALAVGAKYRGLKTGTMGEAGCMSLAPNKILGAFGNAGVVISDRSDVVEEVRSLRNYGKEITFRQGSDRSIVPQRTDYRNEGFNERLDEIQAAVLRVKLSVLEETVEKRRAIAKKYDEGFQSLNMALPSPADDVRHAYRAYTVLVDDRDRLARHLAERDIETAVYYAPPLHLQPPYSYLHHRKGDFPIAEDVAEKMLSFPIYPTMSNEQIEEVIDSVAGFFSLP